VRSKKEWVWGVEERGKKAEVRTSLNVTKGLLGPTVPSSDLIYKKVSHH